jgi:hypothetical protein
MDIAIHPRVREQHPELTDSSVVAAFRSTLRSSNRVRESGPPHIVGVGLDDHGRLLQYVAADCGDDQWLIFHAMLATKKVMREVGLFEGRGIR